MLDTLNATARDSILATLESVNLQHAGLTLECSDAPTFILTGPARTPAYTRDMLLSALSALHRTGFNVEVFARVTRGQHSYVSAIVIRAYCMTRDCSNTVAGTPGAVLCDACRAYILDWTPKTEDENMPYCGLCQGSVPEAGANVGGANVCHECTHSHGMAECAPGACDYSPKFQPVIGRTYAIGYGGVITFTGLETSIYGLDEWTAVIDGRPTHVSAAFVNAWLDICPDCEYSVDPVGDCYNCKAHTWRITSPELLAALGLQRFAIAPESPAFPCDESGFYGCDRPAAFIVCNRAGDYLAATCEYHMTDMYAFPNVCLKAFPTVAGTLFLGSPAEIVSALFPEDARPHAACCPTVSVRVDGKASVARCGCGQPGAYVNVFATGLGMARVEVRCVVCSWLETDCK